ncbi:Metalloenzyme, LuxS/M16 peptidase-like protein [Umbelopsis sp. PMI_123]|nr:Metalloenzyme, LuxS/M16 peptidase-like protein [Umbelopsis sp. PMI_123]
MSNQLWQAATRSGKSILKSSSVNWKASTGSVLARTRSTLQQPEEIKSKLSDASKYPTTVQEFSKSSTGLSKVTTLPNGVRVASENTPGHFSAVGVYVDAGSRYETPSTRGVSHILDRLAFKSTTNATADEMLYKLELLGGNIMCSSSRESIMYQSTVFNQDVPQVMSVFADVIRNPCIAPDEVEEQRQTALYEVQDIWSKPEMFLPEVLHIVAFNENTLGNPLLCPPENLAAMTPELIKDYMNTWYRPERMVVAVCGTDHDIAVKLAEQYFGSIPTSASPLDSVETHKVIQQRQGKGASFVQSLFSSSKSHTAESLATQPAYYSGGLELLESPDLPFTHIQVAFEGLPIHDDDIYALATLQILLGGGGSFSAGGPGKGMYSRLFTNVLNQHYWVESCTAFNHCYTDSGLFGIAASCRPEYTNVLLEVVCRELDLVARQDVGHLGVNQVELNRAKNQLKSSLLMNLESRMVQLEDLGRQVQVQGKKTGIDEMLSKIDVVDLGKLAQVASRIVRGAVSVTSGGSGDATVVAQGDVRSITNPRKILEKYGLGSGKKTW